jgi:hypothetical protein
MKNISYQTEKRINNFKKQEHMTNDELLAVTVWNNIFSNLGYLGGSLKELEDYLGSKLENTFQCRIFDYFKELGIYGIEYRTNGNATFIGTHDLCHVTFKNFNLFVKNLKG